MIMISVCIWHKLSSRMNVTVYVKVYFAFKFFENSVSISVEINATCVCKQEIKKMSCLRAFWKRWYICIMCTKQATCIRTHVHAYMHTSTCIHTYIFPTISSRIDKLNIKIHTILRETDDQWVCYDTYAGIHACWYVKNVRSYEVMHACMYAYVCVLLWVHVWIADKSPNIHKCACTFLCTFTHIHPGGIFLHIHKVLYMYVI